MIRNKELISNLHFCTALIDKKPVIIFLENDLVGKGLIEQVTESSIKINGEYFMRSVCTFLH